jgi:Protein of unknown function (DUF998)
MLACGATAGPLFTLGWILEGATRPDYDPLRHPVSSLELGPFGWTQQANFVVAGTLTLAFAVGLRRALRPRRLHLGTAAGRGPRHRAGGRGAVRHRPGQRYPPGTPDRLPSYGSAHAALHDLLSVGTFVGLPLACLVLAGRFAGWGQRRWAAYSAATGVAMTVGSVLTSMAFKQIEALVRFGGLFQRTTVTVGWTWLTLLAVHLLTAGPPHEGSLTWRNRSRTAIGPRRVPPLAADTPAGLPRACCRCSPSRAPQGGARRCRLRAVLLARRPR